MNEITHVLAMRTSNAVCAAHARGDITDAQAEAHVKDLADLASQLDRGVIGANAYRDAAMAIAASLLG